MHIPKKIHITWRDDNILNVKSSFLDKCIHNVVKLSPNWTPEVSDDAAVDNYIKANLDKSDYNRLKDKHPVEKTDVWRLLKLYNEGGLYIDIDKTCNMSLDDVIGDSIKFVIPTCLDYDFSHDFMCSAPGNPVYALTLQLNLKRRAEGATSVYFLGPQTYMHGASLAILGEMIDPNPGAEVFEHIRKELTNWGFALTYRENPPYETIICRTTEAPNFDHEAEKRNFYREQNLKHWTGEW